MEAVWGLDDEEIELVISPDQVAVLATMLLRERLGREAVSVIDVVAICEVQGVAFKLSCWT